MNERNLNVSCDVTVSSWGVAFERKEMHENRELLHI